MLVETLKNQPIESNCYVIYTSDNNSCIIIDPGTKDCRKLFKFLKSKSLIPKYVILTHEHFDHIWGVNKILDIYQTPIICSEKCWDSIGNNKKNLSIFYNNVGFEINTNHSNKIVKETYFNKSKINLIDTPGHSQGSITILIDNLMFSGDTIMMDTNIVTKLPGGNKKHLAESLKYIQKLYENQNITVYPGHGNFFKFDDLDLSKII